MVTAKKVIDSLGKVEVPIEVFYAAQTARAINNFPISGQRMPISYIRALLLAKWAEANAELTLLEQPTAVTILSPAAYISVRCWP
ncbi:hypothetical protein TUM3794_13800 [Shewanella colwelliana]|uniref:Uncharacterized protein n=1 Tax=Shewanella colwelliana TaxID=23 RepID=A0ABQ4NYG3_SHECO|nr:hypothetical protein [Shewanella colwelliana]GIU39304.1 hypothetical protein TUM3794_13800 [Shewanella colwelliana]